MVRFSDVLSHVIGGCNDRCRSAAACAYWRGRRQYRQTSNYYMGAMYLTLKYLHICLAAITIAGFLLRGFWMLRGSDLLNQKFVKIAPHIVDTGFLLSGIALIDVLNLPILDQPWLLAKFTALIVYIVLGTVALKRGRSLRVRTTAFCLALVTFAYIVGIALTKSTASFAEYLQ